MQPNVYLIMNDVQTIEMLAGCNAQGTPVLEKVPVQIDDKGNCQLKKSPAFIKGIASGDIIRLNEETGQYELQRRSGNLCIRVYSRDDIQPLNDSISPEMELMGGTLDIQTPRMLVYSIHVSCGFEAIEALLNKAIGDKTTNNTSQWLYGNVYDPNDGATPLNWWVDVLKPQ